VFAVGVRRGTMVASEVGYGIPRTHLGRHSDRVRRHDVLGDRTAERRGEYWCWLFGSGCGGSREASSQQGVPEIDPGALVSAIALAAGGVAMLSDRVPPPAVGLRLLRRGGAVFRLPGTASPPDPFDLSRVAG